MAKQIIDWLTIKQFYFSDPKVSIRDIANKFDVSFYSVRNKAQEEGWSKKRREQFAKIEEKVLKEQREDIVDVRVRQAKILKGLLAKVLNLLKDRDFSSMSEKDLIKAVLDILRSERELYPKQLEMVGRIPCTPSLDDIPECVVDAYIELVEQKISGSSIPRSRKPHS